jgi:hypothetical protein
MAARKATGAKSRSGRRPAAVEPWDRSGASYPEYRGTTGLLLDAMVSASAKPDAASRAMTEVLAALVQAYISPEHHHMITDTAKTKDGALAWARRRKGELWGLAEAHPDRAMATLQLVVMAAGRAHGFGTQAAVYLLRKGHLFDVSDPAFENLKAAIEDELRDCEPVEPHSKTERASMMLRKAGAQARAALRGLGLSAATAKQRVEGALSTTKATDFVEMAWRQSAK